MARTGSKIKSKLFIAEKIIEIMTNEPEKFKKLFKEHSDDLAKLGKEMADIQFNYRIIENTSEQYWQNRINEFKKYNEKGLEYYTKAHTLMNLVDKDASGLFLLSISKLHQNGLKLIATMEEVKQNPSIIKLKDKQQSKWSKELRERLIEISNTCLHHEMDMNKLFRDFYETRLKKLV